MIKYIGSKRLLVPVILDIIQNLPHTRTVVDLFSGTSRVGYALKSAGYRVLANDHNAYAETLARCYVQADAEDVLKDAERLIKELNTLKGKPGYFTETFCIKSRFFHPKNGEKIDAIRDEIARKSLHPELEAVLLTSLMEAADRVDSTTGVQMAYLKKWAPRALNDIVLRVPAILPRARNGKSIAYCMDAIDAARELQGDVVYIDPPYNQHSYLANYHIWESLVRWDKPPVYGVACKRLDVRTRKSPFNSKKRIREAIRQLLKNIQARAVVLSFNNEGFLTPVDIEEMLNSLWDGRANVIRIEKNYNRYVGAKIGIYNPEGQKVGTVTHTKNKEYIYVATAPDISYTHSIHNKTINQLSLFD